MWATVEVTNISMSAATLTVSLSEGAVGETLHLRFRSMPNGPWIGGDRLSFIGRIAQTRLTGLEAGASYEVQVSRESTFRLSDSLTGTFTTLPPDPYISDIRIENITKSTATVVITISHPGLEPNKVYIRYRLTTLNLGAIRQCLRQLAWKLLK